MIDPELLDDPEEGTGTAGTDNSVIDNEYDHIQFDTPDEDDDDD